MDYPAARLSRRSFLKLAAANLAAMAFRLPDFAGFSQDEWPNIALDGLPTAIQDILLHTPRSYVDMKGFLILRTEQGKDLGQVPLSRTQWNLERSKPHDRLQSKLPWGIVLHWYGDRENSYDCVADYLRGFDSLRGVSTYITRTSAHFLIGKQAATTKAVERDDPIGILQTQMPDVDGTPFLASHLQPLDYVGHRQRKQYFVRAWYQLARQEARIHSLLQDFFDGSWVDPNMYTIAIEVSGYDFEHPEHLPPSQQLGNLLSVVWAVMKRYRIQAVNLLGHNEIQLGKPDPGKKFMALMRYLVGVKALLSEDLEMKNLVFGNFLEAGVTPEQAVQKYFKFVRDYLVLVGTQRSVYEWETISNYWLLNSQLNGEKIRLAKSYYTPFDDLERNYNLDYLKPENHEGVDFLIKPAKNQDFKGLSIPVHLVADGTCVYIGENDRCSPGKSAIFRHIQPDGAQILTVFSNLSEMGDLRVGEAYSGSFRLGAIQSERSYISPSLHLAVAYGATWDTDLKIQAEIPINAGENWIQARYINPLEYFRGLQ